MFWLKRRESVPSAFVPLWPWLLAKARFGNQKSSEVLLCSLPVGAVVGTKEEKEDQLYLPVSREQLGSACGLC